MENIYSGQTASQVGHMVLALVGLTSSLEAKHPISGQIRD